MSSLNIVRKFGHCGVPKTQREISDISMLLTKIKQDAPAENVNLVINNPSFLIGGNQQPYDQGQLGSCTANALSFSFVFNAVKQGYTPFMPSRLDAYFQERLHMGGRPETLNDNGANISDCEYVLETIGLLPEASWKYTDNYKNKLYYTMPNEAKDDVRTLAFDTNTMYKVNPTNLNEVKMVLTNGYPLICGMLVDTDVFCSDAVTCSGIVTKVPNPRRGNISGHAVVIIGYTSDGYFLIRNSWGVNWGLGFLNQSTGSYNYDEFRGKMRGYFKVPFSYITTKGIVLELYAIKGIKNTTNTINSTAYTLDPICDTSFKSEITLKPIPILSSSLVAESIKMRIDLSYYKSTNDKYIWIVTTLKYSAVLSSYQVLYELELTNISYNNLTKCGFYQKGKMSNVYSSGATIAVTYSDKIADVISFNISNGKMALVASYKV